MVLMLPNQMRQMLSLRLLKSRPLSLPRRPKTPFLSGYLPQRFSPFHVPLRITFLFLFLFISLLLCVKPLSVVWFVSPLELERCGSVSCVVKIKYIIAISPGWMLQVLLVLIIIIHPSNEYSIGLSNPSCIFNSLSSICFPSKLSVSRNVSSFIHSRPC